MFCIQSVWGRLATRGSCQNIWNVVTQKASSPSSTPFLLRCLADTFWNGQRSNLSTTRLRREGSVCVLLSQESTDFFGSFSLSERKRFFSEKKAVLLYQKGKEANLFCPKESDSSLSERKRIREERSNYFCPKESDSSLSERKRSFFYQKGSNSSLPEKKHRFSRQSCMYTV